MVQIWFQKHMVSILVDWFNCCRLSSRCILSPRISLAKSVCSFWDIVHFDSSTKSNISWQFWQAMNCLVKISLALVQMHFSLSCSLRQKTFKLLTTQLIMATTAITLRGFWIKFDFRKSEQNLLYLRKNWRRISLIIIAKYDAVHYLFEMLC